MRIAAILPSRGLLFSQSFEELLRELKPFKHKIYFAHGRPIPECFNEPLEQALADKKNTHVLFVEDDMALPKGILKKMVEGKWLASALDYPFRADGEATILHDPAGYALYTGTGFLLVDRIILDKMPKPIMRTNTAWDLRIEGKVLYMWPRDVSKIKTYGLHDINFGLTLWTNNIPIVPVAPCGQRKLLALGRSGTNNGAHIIKVLSRVGVDNITKTDNPHLLKAWSKRIAEVTSVEILDHIPNDIEYRDGQAHLRQGGEQII